MLTPLIGEYHNRKKCIFIKSISKLEKQYGDSKGYIGEEFNRTCSKKYHVHNSVAAKIWSDMNRNLDQVEKIRKDEELLNKLVKEEQRREKLAREL